MSRTKTLAVLLGIGVVVCCGCTSEADNEALRLVSSSSGLSRTDVVSRAGAPTLEREIKRSDTRGPCATDSGGAVRVLEYHLPRSGPMAYVRRTFGSRPSILVAVCLDSDSRVTATHMIQF